MADNKNLRLRMSGSNLQIGKTGPKIKISSGIVEFRNATDSAYAVARAGNPIDDDDAVPKAWAATNIGDSGIPLSIIRKSDTTGTDTYTLPTAVAGDTITVSKHSSQQITNILRIQPASGDKIAIYGSVIENPGYIEVYDAATVFKFHSLNADIWALASHFRKTEFGELINQGKFALFGRDTWVTKTNLTTGVSGAGSFDANGYAYVLCGNTGAITNLTQQYNDSTNAWAAKTVNPTSRYLLCGLTLNGFGYTTCGNPAVNTSTGAHTQYNDAGNSWTAKTANPTVRETASVMSFNGYCYVVGGSSNGTANVQTVNNQYNDATNAWTAKAVTPTSRTITMHYSMNGFGHVIGGSNAAGSADTALHERYNDSSNAWETKAPDNFSRYDGSGFNLNGYGMIVGGIDLPAVTLLTVATQYNEAINAWTTKTAMGTATYSGIGNNLNGYGYSTSGAPTNTKNVQYN